MTPGPFSGTREAARKCPEISCETHSSGGRQEGARRQGETFEVAAWSSWLDEDGGADRDDSEELFHVRVVDCDASQGPIAAAVDEDLAAQGGVPGRRGFRITPMATTDGTGRISRQNAQGLDPTADWSRVGGALLLLAFSWLALPRCVDAQGGEGFVTFQFSFSNPGARSLGLGGAFVALADDATAAFANPAGLVQLVESEVSLEGRYWSYSTAFTQGGRIDGQPTGIGIDTDVGLRIARSHQDVSGVSFLSLVYPRERWSFAVYRHQLANFEFASQTNGLFRETGPPYPPGVTSRSLDVRATTNFEVLGWGVAGAYRVSDELSLGLGLTYFDGEVSSELASFLFDSPERFFFENSYLPQSLVATVDWSIDDTDLGLTGGFLWRISERWRAGGFYREGPELQLVGTASRGPAWPLIFPDASEPGADSTPIRLPDVYGLGVAYRSTDGTLALAVEWDRIEYSTIIDSLTIEANVMIEDGDELHVGGEYVFVRTSPVVALRAGAWLDPDHRSVSTSEGRVDRALFRPGDDELHWSFGLGLAFTRLQLDLAADLSDTVDTVSLSTIYRF